MRYMTTAERGKPGSQHAAGRFFAEPVRDYVLQHLGQPISVLQAGCLAPLRELALDELAEGGFDVSVTAVDSDDPLAKRVLRDTQSAYDDVITGDLRTVPIPQRAYDVVYCALLLERVRHVELVLDRLTSALKPGGLLLVRTGDRYTATAFLNRMMPRPGPAGGLVEVPSRHPRPVPGGVREGGQRGRHRRLRADARPGHRGPRQRADPPGPAVRAFVVRAGHLRGHRPAERRPLRRRPRRAALRDPQAARPLRPGGVT